MRTNVTDPLSRAKQAARTQGKARNMATKPMRTFKVRVLIVPPTYMTALTGEQPRYEVRTIKGYTLADAKRRAGIE